MLQEAPKIAVTTSAFSSNPELAAEIKKYFPNVSLNGTGKRYSLQELTSNLADASGAIIGLDHIDNALLKNCPRLEVISKYGVGLDNLDLDACVENGVKVLWKPGVNKRGVAELTLGLMSGLMRNWYQSSLQFKDGKWNKNGGRSLTGKTIGIIGVGNIGKDLISLLRPYNCQVLVNDIREDKKQRNFYIQNKLSEESKEAIYKKSDIITIHTPLTGLTKNMVDAYVFSIMKSTSFLINTARGGLVDEGALLWALKNGIIA